MSDVYLPIRLSTKDNFNAFVADFGARYLRQTADKPTDKPLCFFPSVIKVDLEVLDDGKEYRCVILCNADDRPICRKPNAVIFSIFLYITTL